jgi:6-phosphogluconolactonase
MVSADHSHHKEIPLAGTDPTYIVATWTKPDDDQRLRTGLWRLTLGPQPTAIPVDPDPTAIYWATAEPGQASLLLLNNDDERSALLRWPGPNPAQPNPRWSSGGEGGSYLAFHPSGTHFAVANSSAGWSLFRNGPTPQLVDTHRNTGSGPHPRQAHSHPHCAIFTPDGRWLLAADMGADEILAIPVDLAAERFGEAVHAYRATPGSGPRHLVPGPGVLYTLNELGNSVEVLHARDDMTLECVQVQPTIPPDCTGENYGAHLGLALDGRRLLASNRGHDSIAVFDVLGDGRLGDASWIASGGAWPWHFLLTEDHRMLVANNQSDEVAVFDTSNGKLQLLMSVAVPRPVFVAAEP